MPDLYRKKWPPGYAGRGSEKWLRGARKTGARYGIFDIINFKRGSEPTSYMEKSGLPDVTDSLNLVQIRDFSSKMYKFHSHIPNNGIIFCRHDDNCAALVKCN